jgi:hypothetical protein
MAPLWTVDTGESEGEGLLDRRIFDNNSVVRGVPLLAFGRDELLLVRTGAQIGNAGGA